MYKIAVPKNLKDIYKMSNKKFEPNDPLGEIAKKYKSVKEVFLDLNKPDKLTDAIYGEPDEEGKYLFPMMEEPDPGVEPHKGFIGDQSSYWHNENLKEHACYVAYHLRNAGLNLQKAGYLGVLHDCGKKYCAETNHAGEVWFNDHEYISALLVACWTKDWHWMLKEAERKELIAIIYGHMQCLLEWHKGTPESAKIENDFVAEVTEFLGNETAALRVYGLVCILGTCDEGARGGAPVDKKIIEEGEKIISLTV